jgi:hypothetical protein
MINSAISGCANELNSMLVMNLFISGITNCFSVQSFDMNPEIQVFPVYLPCLIFPNIYIIIKSVCQPIN